MKSHKKNVLIRIWAIVMTALLTAFLLPGVRAKAEGAVHADIDTGRKGSLTVTHLSADDEPVEGVTSGIFLVATMDENGIYTITEDFRDFFTDPDFFNNGFDYDSWKECVKYEPEGDTDRLCRYIEGSDGIKPFAQSVSDAKGKTCYIGLTLGIYYVLSDRVVKGDYTHSFANFVYPVPLLETDENGAVRVNYDPEVSPKKSSVNNEDIVSCCSLVKRWDDDGYSDKRPVEVSFNIYCDGELWRVDTLSAANNWKVTWNLKGEHFFSVEEIDAGEGYTGRVECVNVGHDFEFICTNTYSPPDTPENPPDTPENPPDTPENPPGIPDIPEVLGAIRDLPEVLGARRLPQTGQLWWPLPILVIAGICLIIKGIKKNAANKAK